MLFEAANRLITQAPPKIAALEPPRLPASDAPKILEKVLEQPRHLVWRMSCLKDSLSKNQPTERLGLLNDYNANVLRSGLEFALHDIALISNELHRDSLQLLELIDQEDGNSETVSPAATRIMSTQQVTKQPKAHQCPSCEKTFTRATTLREHVRSHTDERPFACTKCSKKFACSKDCKRHESVHSTQKAWRCSGTTFRQGRETPWGCGRAFAREDGLLEHLRSENGGACTKDLPEIHDFFYLRCSLENDGRRCQSQPIQTPSFGCGLSFASLENTRSHLLSDAGVRCQRQFLAATALNRLKVGRKTRVRARQNMFSTLILHSLTKPQRPKSSGTTLFLIPKGMTRDEFPSC